eukprot:4640226-Ditylum_brightwellii.AAC.1
MMLDLRDVYFHLDLLNGVEREEDEDKLDGTVCGHTNSCAGLDPSVGFNEETELNCTRVKEDMEYPACSRELWE